MTTDVSFMPETSLFSEKIIFRSLSNMRPESGQGYKNHQGTADTDLTPHNHTFIGRMQHCI